MQGDGDGWSAGPDGTRRWGRHGAAGLVLVDTRGDEPSVLLQHRATWTAEGGTWGVPGGARDSHETAAEAAVREAVEEAGIDTTLIDVRAELVTAGPFPADPRRPELAGQWTYTTIVATADGQIPVTPNEESLELRWVGLGELENYPLLPAFAESWPNVYQVIRKLLSS